MLGTEERSGQILLEAMTLMTKGALVKIQTLLYLSCCMPTSVEHS